MASIQCANCGKDIPASAKACQYCEAPVTDGPSEEEKAAVMQILDEMDPQAREALMKAARSAETGEEFISSILVGSCPNCESENTGDCEDDPEIENPLVGRCLDCHCHWCTECGRILDVAHLDCPCWNEDIPGLPNA